MLTPGATAMKKTLFVLLIAETVLCPTLDLILAEHHLKAWAH